MVNQRQHQRKMKLYFDVNDEFVNEDLLPEFLNFRRLHSRPDEDSDEIEEMHLETIQIVRQKYHSVLVNFGSEEEQISGTTKITRDIFIGGDKSENALLFLENLDKVSKTKKP